MKRLALFILLAELAFSLFAQEPANEMMQLTKIKSGLKTRQISSNDKTGGNADFIGKIKDGDKLELMNVKGAGVINRIWITIAPEGNEVSRYDVVIRMYWDENSYPSVESPLGPFFGNG
jgi:hypothetical protein